MNDDRRFSDADPVPRRTDAHAPPEPPLTIAQRTMLSQGLRIVDRAAKRVAKRFHRFVQPDELLAVGTIELHAAVRAFDPAYSNAFEDYAFYRIRCAMIKAMGAELFQDRIRRSVDIATDQFWAYVADRDYDASKHDDVEARRRFRAIANGMLGAAFTAAVEEAQKPTPESEIAEQAEYAVAIHALRAALQKLSDADHRVLVELYRELKSMKEVSKELGIPYSTLKRRHAAALERLREHLVAHGVERAPEPRVVPQHGSVVALRQPGGRDPPRSR